MHIRSTIRQAIVNLLDAELPTSPYVVMGARLSKRNREGDGLAMVDARFADVAVTQQTMGNDRLHTASLMIRVQREGDEETIDDDLDADELAITGILNRFDWSSLLEDDPELTQISFAYDTESEVTIGVLVLRFTVEYRIDKNDPETVRA